MGILIEDGLGSGKNVGVTKRNEMLTRSDALDESSFVAQYDSQYFIWQSDYSALAGDFVLYLKNTDRNRDLKIRKIYFYNSAATTWEVHRVDDGTPAGTEIIGENLSFGSGVTPNSDQYGNAAITGITESTMMFSYVLGAGASHYLDANGAVIINNNNALAIKTTGAGTIKVYVAGYFVNKID